MDQKKSTFFYDESDELLVVCVGQPLKEDQIEFEIWNYKFCISRLLNLLTNKKEMHISGKQLVKNWLERFNSDQDSFVWELGDVPFKFTRDQIKLGRD